MGDFGNCWGVQKVDLWVGDGFGEECFGVGLYCCLLGVQIVWIVDEVDFDVEFGQ